MGAAFQIRFNVSGGDDCLAAFNAVEEHLLAVGVQFREDIVQEEDGFFVGFFFVKGEFEQFECQQE